MSRVCIGCGVECSVIVGRRKYCSKVCKEKAIQESQKRCKDKVSVAFCQFKESIGCSACGYDRFGGSLDFHHLEARRFRITGWRWWSNSEELQVEISKCILLCKNCHYELEHKVEV